MKLKLILLSTLLAGSLAATEYNFYNETLSLENSTGIGWSDSEIFLRFGKFESGFTATAFNTEAWETHWISFNISGDSNGYYSPDGPEWNAGFSAANNNVFAAGEQLYVWAFDSLDGSTREWALFTDTTWLVETNSQIDPSLHSYEFTTDTQSILGSLDLDGGLASTALVVGSTIPEPASWSALAGGAALACSFWNRRRRAAA
jgi:hypothetical protein